MNFKKVRLKKILSANDKEMHVLVDAKDLGLGDELMLLQIIYPRKRKKGPVAEDGKGGTFRKDPIQSDANARKPIEEEVKAFKSDAEVEHMQNLVINKQKDIY